MKDEELANIVKEVALVTLDISYKAGVGHIGSALSISDLLTVLYFSKLNLSSDTLNSPLRDRFILSKGHAAAALYAVLYKKRIISHELLESFARDEGGLSEHPEISTPGIEMTAGSLGHGLAFGVGVAYGLQKKHIPSTVYVLISDGECGEGSIWEAALLAPRLQLGNLVAILDYNKWQCLGSTNDITPLEPLADKWRAFGWDVFEIDGHSIHSIQEVFNTLGANKEKPTIIIAHTISGKGISCIQDQLVGHYKIFSKEEYEQARKELISI